MGELGSESSFVCRRVGIQTRTIGTPQQRSAGFGEQPDTVTLLAHDFLQIDSLSCYSTAMDLPPRAMEGHRNSTVIV